MQKTSKKEEVPMGQCVGIDLHLRSTTIVRMAEDGEVLGTERFVSEPLELAQAMVAAGPDVVLESTYGWYWAAALLQELGAHVHLAHALGNDWGNRRVKNDVRDARTWRFVGPRATGRRLDRATPRARATRARALSLLAHPAPHQCQGPDPRGHGQERDPPVVGELWGPTGSAQLDRLELPEAYAMRLESLRNLLDVYEAAIAELDAHIHAELKADPGYRALLTLPGVGKVIAAIFVAEIGDVSRFDSAKKLCSWAGLTPEHRESDEVVHHGAITTQGSPLVRWAAIEAVGNYRSKGNEKLRADYRRIAEHAGKYKARVAVARKLLNSRLLCAARRGGPMPRGRRLSLGHGPTRARRTPYGVWGHPQAEVDFVESANSRGQDSEQFAIRQAPWWASHSDRVAVRRCRSTTTSSRFLLVGSCREGSLGRSAGRRFSELNPPEEGVRFYAEGIDGPWIVGSIFPKHFASKTPRRRNRTERTRRADPPGTLSSPCHQGATPARRIRAGNGFPQSLSRRTEGGDCFAFSCQGVESSLPIDHNLAAPKATWPAGGAFLQSETSGGECQMAIEEAALIEPEDFTAEVRDEDGATVVTLSGELDLSTAGALREVLVLPEVLNAPAVRVDLTQVDFLGSTGVGLLVSACKRIKASGGSFSVICAKTAVRHVLEISGLLDYLHVESAA
jgi:anti-anti-sigma factor